MQYKPSIRQHSFFVRLSGYALIATIALLLVSLILEVLFRQMPEYARTGFSYDKNLIWRFNRNLTSTKAYAMGKLDKEPFRLTFNNQGFRGEDFDLSRGGGVTRIMFLGDSYTAGLDYPYPETFVGILEQKLGESGQRIEILNASCPAWGTDQEYVYWITEGRRYNPDYLILVIAPNDIREGYNKKLVEFNASNELTVNTPYIPAKERIYWKLSNWFSTFQFVQKLTGREYGSFKRIFHYFVVNYGKEDHANWDFPIFLKEPFQEVIESYHLNEAMIADLNERTKRQGTQLLLTVIPARIEFSGELDTSTHQPGRVAKHLQSVAQKYQIPFLDTYEAAGLLNDPMDLYMDWEFHFDPEGHQFMAEQLQPFLLKCINTDQ